MDINHFGNFLYYLNQRRESNLGPTGDTVIDNFHFGNLYRVQDKTTMWLLENVIKPRHYHQEVLMAVYIFRRFNTIAAGELLNSKELLTNWNGTTAKRILRRHQRDVGPIFTPAYQITPTNRPKIEAVCDLITKVWVRRYTFVAAIESFNTLQNAQSELTTPHFSGLPPWIVTLDLVNTYLLSAAFDLSEWCYLTPKARSALVFLQLPPNYHGVIECRKVLHDSGLNMPLYDVERNLANFDIYMDIHRGIRGIRRSYERKV